MYLRFIGGAVDDDSGLETGLFGPALDIVYGDSAEAWLWRELRMTLDWFNDHLDQPAVFRPSRRMWNGRCGVCWFRPEATAHIRQARHLAWLVSQAGAPIREVRARQVGEIVWRDEHQIVAAPNRSGPVYLN